MLGFYQRFLYNQALAMGLVSPKAQRNHHIVRDHSDKTFWKSVWVGVSCAFYWILSFQVVFLVQTPRNYLAGIFVLVGICSTSADTGLFRNYEGIMRINQVCDRWMATIGCFTIFVEIYLEFARSIAVGIAMVMLTLLAFFTLQTARERVHKHGHDWGWVVLHTTWHAITVAGAAWVLYRADSETDFVCNAALDNEEQYAPF